MEFGHPSTLFPIFMMWRSHDKKLSICYAALLQLLRGLYRGIGSCFIIARSTTYLVALASLACVIKIHAVNHRGFKDIVAEHIAGFGHALSRVHLR